eukprot:15476573-Alexandrium_andersonii.AAC.1
MDIWRGHPISRYSWHSHGALKSQGELQGAQEIVKEQDCFGEHRGVDGGLVGRVRSWSTWGRKRHSPAS